MTQEHPSEDPTPTSESRPAPPVTEPAPDPLRHSRTSAVWTAAALLGFFLVLLIIFVVQNTQTAHINFLGWDGSAPQAVMLLIAAVAGLAVTGLAGALRILQLRRRIKRSR
jgi:uncharacterized integral membrane protein